MSPPRQGTEGHKEPGLWWVTWLPLQNQVSTFPKEMRVLRLKKGETGWQIKTAEVTVGGAGGGSWVGDARLENLSCTGHLAGEGKSGTKACRQFLGGPVVRTPSFHCQGGSSSISGLRTKVQGLTKKKKKDESLQISEAREDSEAQSQAPAAEERPRGRCNDTHGERCLPWAGESITLQEALWWR